MLFAMGRNGYAAAFAMISLFLFCAVSACRASSSSDSRATDKAHHVFYLHGKIIEDEGADAVSPKFGPYEYRKIVKAFESRGFFVHSEVRPRNTDPVQYAKKIAKEIEKLRAGGVPSKNIGVVGASKGGVVAVRISALLKDTTLRFVILSGLFKPLLDDSGLKLYGDILSIHDRADTLPIVPEEFFKRSRGLGRHKSIVTKLDLGHGLLYRPLPEWLDPATSWLKE